MGRLALPLVFLAVGAVVAGLGGSMYVDRQELADTGERVAGTVTGVRSSTDSEGDTTYAPVYSYTHRGQPRQHSPDATSSSRPTEGEQVTLFIDPDEPGRVMADTFMDRWFLPVLLGGIGAVLLVVGGALAVAALRGGTRTGSRDERRARHEARVDGRETRTEVPEVRSGPFVGDARHDQRGPFL